MAAEKLEADAKEAERLEALKRQQEQEQEQQQQEQGEERRSLKTPVTDRGGPNAKTAAGEEGLQHSTTTVGLSRMASYRQKGIGAKSEEDEWRKLVVSGESACSL